MNLLFSKDLEGKGVLRIRMAEIDVPHLDKILTFSLPLTEKGNYTKLMRKIDSKKLIRATTAENLSLIKLALKNPNEAYCNQILNIFRGGYLLSCTENLPFSEGTLVYDNVDGKMPRNSHGLIELLNNKDRRVKYVKPGFFQGTCSIQEFLKNPYIIAQIGEEMIPTTEEVAKLLNEKETYVYGPIVLIEKGYIIQDYILHFQIREKCCI